MKRLSVVIANHNYEQYVAAAIESALDLCWPDLEVVVVDDGSTDDSLTVIERYADRVHVLRTENSSQRVAANRGFALSSGDVVIFLDSDDLLPPDLAEHLAAAWTPAVSKAQFRMQRIDERGRPFGDPFPSYEPPPTPRQIHDWARRTTAYPTPPGSGNAYARWFLEQIFPVGDEVGNAADSACLAAAPFFGDVVSVPEVVVLYRRHGANDSDLLKDRSRFAREVARARARWHFAQTASGASTPVDERPLFRSRELLQLRVASRQASPRETELPGDSAARMLVDTVRSPFHSGPEHWRQRVAIAGWCLAVLAAPPSLAQRLLALRYGRSG